MTENTPASGAKILRLIVRHTHQYPDWFKLQAWHSPWASMPRNKARHLAEHMIAARVVDQSDYWPICAIAQRYFTDNRAPT